MCEKGVLQCTYLDMPLYVQAPLWSAAVAESTVMQQHPPSSWVRPCFCCRWPWPSCRTPSSGCISPSTESTPPRCRAATYIQFQITNGVFSKEWPRNFKKIYFGEVHNLKHYYCKSLQTKNFLSNILRKLCGDILPLQNNYLNFSEFCGKKLYNCFLDNKTGSLYVFSEKTLGSTITTNKQKKKDRTALFCFSRLQIFPPKNYAWIKSSVKQEFKKCVKISWQPYQRWCKFSQ